MYPVRRAGRGSRGGGSGGAVGSRESCQGAKLHLALLHCEAKEAVEKRRAAERLALAKAEWFAEREV